MALLFALSILVFVITAIYASERVIFRKSPSDAVRIIGWSITPDAIIAILLAVFLLIAAAIAVLLT